jgi:hypothetical protein
MLHFIAVIALFGALVILLGQCVILFFETFIPDLYAKTPKSDETFVIPDHVTSGRLKVDANTEELAIKNAENFGPAETVIFPDVEDYEKFAKSVKLKKKKVSKKSKKKKSPRRRK